MLKSPESTSRPLTDPITSRRYKSTLETTLLANSPPAETDIRKANKELLETVRKLTDIPSPAKRYVARLTSALEEPNTERTLLRNDNTEARELLRYRKERTKGKFVFNTREILEVVEKAEVEAAIRRSKTRRRTRSSTPKIEEEEEELLEILSDESEGECIVISGRK